MSTVLAEARAFLGLDLEQVRSTLGPAADAAHDDRYGRMGGLTSVEDLQVFPGTVYLRDDRVVLVFVETDDVPDLTVADLTASLGPVTAELASKAGKQATLVVHAEDGVAYSEQAGVLDFLEVFEPRTQAAYEAEIYVDPGAFIR